VLDANLVTGNLIIKAVDGDAIPQKVHRSDVKFTPRAKKQKIEETEE